MMLQRQSSNSRNNADGRPTLETEDNMDISAPPFFARHDSEFSADSGYASSPHKSLSSTTQPLKSQYLEALYSTKTSLAYFAKSALSRARSEFHRLQGSHEDSLVSLLQNLILLEDDFNAKYENFIPSLIEGDAKESSLITKDEQGYLVQKFKRYGKGTDINNSVLQREINDLKIREYIPPYQSNIELNYKSSSSRNYSHYTMTRKMTENV
jgi:DNA replication regulator SLD3